MINPALNRIRRLFGHRDWPAGEPYMVGGICMGLVLPDGSVILDIAPDEAIEIVPASERRGAV